MKAVRHRDSIINPESDHAQRTALRVLALRGIVQAVLLLVWLLFIAVSLHAQVNVDPQAGDKSALLIDGVSNSIVYGMGQSMKITGTVKGGAIAFGGDVIVQGSVEGDVAAIGGSVIQLEGSRIAGDVIVLGGTYRHADKFPNRSPGSTTVMYAGYEQELRNMMRNPSGLLTPHWSPTYIAMRLLALLFWFVVSWVVMAVMPGTVSKGIARLQLTSLRVAIIGFVGAIVVAIGVDACLWLLPPPLSVLVGIMALLLILLASLFGRVVIYAATGRWLLRKYAHIGKSSESVILLFGTAVWIMLSSLPHIWPLVVAVMLVMSLGLALTIGHREGWNGYPQT
jgi:hypothetical protein